MNTLRVQSVAICLLFSTCIHAQFRDFMTFGGKWYEDDAKNDKNYMEKKSVPYSVNMTSGVPTGVGLEFAYRFNPHFSTRFSVHYADLSLNGYKLSFKGTQSEKQDLLFDLKIKQSHAGMFADYYLTPMFRLWGGLQYYFANTVSLGGELSGIVKFNDVNLNGNDLGSGVLTMGFNSWVTPSVGIGFGRVVPSKRLSFSTDIGAQYRGLYIFDIKIKEGLLLKKNEDNSRVLERNFNRQWYQRVFPLIQLRLSYNFKYKKIPPPPIQEAEAADDEN